MRKVIAPTSRAAFNVRAEPTKDFPPRGALATRGFVSLAGNSFIGNAGTQARAAVLPADYYGLLRIVPAFWVEPHAQMDHLGEVYFSDYHRTAVNSNASPTSAPTDKKGVRYRFVNATLSPSPAFVSVRPGDRRVGLESGAWAVG